MNLLALDLGTATGWALRTADGHTVSGTESFKPGRFEGGGMRYLRFKRWLTEIKAAAEPLGAIYFEEVRRHIGVDAAHAYGGFLATLTAWCEHHQIPYSGVPVGTIKRHATGKGNAGKDVVIAAMRALGHQPGDDNEADALALLTLAVSLAETVSATDTENTGLSGLCVSSTHTSTHEDAQKCAVERNDCTPATHARAQRRAGEMLAQTEKATGAKGSGSNQHEVRSQPSTAPTLAQMGIT